MNHTSSALVQGVIPVTNKSTNSLVTVTPKPSTQCTTTKCPTNTVTGISKVKGKVMVALSDGTYYLTNLNKLDISSFTESFKSVVDIKLKENTLTGISFDPVSNKSMEFTIELPKGSVSDYGIVKLANVGDINKQGTSEYVLTVESGKALIDSYLPETKSLPKGNTLTKGIVRFATSEESINLSQSDVVLSPKSAGKLIYQELNKIDNLPKASTTDIGVVQKQIIFKNNAGNILGYTVE